MRQPGSDTVRRAKLHLVDLAGCVWMHGYVYGVCAYDVIECAYAVLSVSPRAFRPEIGLMRSFALVETLAWIRF